MICKLMKYGSTDEVLIQHLLMSSHKLARKKRAISDSGMAFIMFFFFICVQLFLEKIYKAILLLNEGKRATRNLKRSQHERISAPIFNKQMEATRQVSITLFLTLR